MKSAVKFTAVLLTAIVLSALAGAEGANPKSKIAKRKAPPPQPIYLTESEILTGKVRSVGKDGSSFVLNKMPVKLTNMTRFFQVYETPLSELKKDEAIMVYGKTTSIMKSAKGETGNMMVRGVVSGEAKTFIDLRPTQKAKAEAAKEASKRRTKRKEVLGWHRGTVESLSPLMIHANGRIQRVQASRGAAAITITEGNKEYLTKRIYVVVVADEESSEETAEEAEEDESSTKRKSKRSRRRNKRSRKKKKEVQVSAKTIYIAKGSALLEFLLDPPQPVTKKTRTSTSNDKDSGSDYKSGTTRSQAIRSAKPSRSR